MALLASTISLPAALFWVAPVGAAVVTRKGSIVVSTTRSATSLGLERGLVPHSAVVTTDRPTHAEVVRFFSYPFGGVNRTVTL